MNTLERQHTETVCLEALVKDLEKELFDIHQHLLLTNWNCGFNDYYPKRREVFTKLVYAEADLKRSKAKEEALKRVMARQHEVEAAY
jgi:hypothetical protein